MKTKPRKVLIISCSGGGGCLQAAVAKEQEERSKDPTVVIVKRNMMEDWYWKIIARFGIGTWDSAQKKGRLGILQWLVNCQKYADVIFWPWIFYHALTTMLKEDVDDVIDTQPLGTSAVLSALRIFNERRKKKAVLEKVVVDLPTELNTHFFYPIKKLSLKDRGLLRMATIPPLLKEGETVDDFWKRNCNLTDKEIKYDYYPVRQSFRKYQGKKREERPLSFVTRTYSSEEEDLLARTLARGSLKSELVDHQARFLIEPQDKVATILLGSQPAKDATLGYVRNFIAIAREEQAVPVHLFVFCSHHKPGQVSLLRQVAELVLETLDYPSNLTVVPVSFQTDETIAPLFHRSDVTCTRSGGQTAMELMCVMKGQIWIHSEAKKPASQVEDLSLKQMLKGIPGWESGNAYYLHKLHGAKIVTPDNFIPYGRALFCTEAASSCR